MTTTVAGKCWQCGTELSKYDYGRETLCLKCGKPTRACRNCRWYDPAFTNQCREPQADKVLDKTRANYCDYFEATADPRSESDSGADYRQAAEALFK
ncbi:hypothetical protein [Sedimenticola thiotaurini]|uniref:Uncharacterized protein n=1 Tax=Sedimenticola thiotaurini TaxID=1543721 RepID=A0A0F7K1S9_9GAMM|nr:hypothetical protein [Sedimenticola thiotaurini]AKH21125.1 hypothetical protein AAY24_13020 [Sedimenticola thiotaurini]